MLELKADIPKVTRKEAIKAKAKEGQKEDAGSAEALIYRETALG